MCIKKAVLFGLPRSLKPEVKAVLATSHHIQEAHGFAQRHRGKVDDANIIVVYIDAMSNKTLEDIYATRPPQSHLFAIRSDKSARKIPLPSSGLLHCVSAGEVAEHLARFTS